MIKRKKYGRGAEVEGNASAAHHYGLLYDTSVVMEQFSCTQVHPKYFSLLCKAIIYKKVVES
jgi:hypothetical protein